MKQIGRSLVVFPIYEDILVKDHFVRPISLFRHAWSNLITYFNESSSPFFKSPPDARIKAVLNKSNITKPRNDAKLLLQFPCSLPVNYSTLLITLPSWYTVK